METPFFTPSYLARSSNLADSQLINLFPTVVETHNGSAIGAFYMTPGLDLKATVGTGPIRGVLPVTSLQLCVVSGSSVYVVDTNWNATLCGTMATSTGPVSIITNNRQTNIFDGQAGYLLTGTTLAPLTMPFGNPTFATYQDDFGLVIFAGTNLCAESNAGDLSIYNALNFTAFDALPGNAVSIGTLNEQLWAINETDTEIWADQGLAGFSFARVSGALIERGSAAAYSLAKVGDYLMMVSRNLAGVGEVVLGAPYTWTRISTHALEAEMATWPTLSDIVGFGYQQEGHLFYQMTSPSGNATWVYDLTTSEQLKIPCWHKRASFLNGQFNRHWANCYAFFNGSRVVGDYQNGNLYAYDLDTATDNGTQRKWLRMWRALPQPSRAPVRFPPLTIAMETGAQVPDGTNPQVVLRWTDDGGHNFSDEHFRPAGKTGETAHRVKWNRLGSTRRNSGLDRYFELSSSDPFKVALLGAYLE